MTSFSVKLNTSQVAAYLRDCPRAVRAAAQAAINSMSPEIREEAASGISSVYNIKKAVAKRGIKMVARASPAKLRARWEPSGKAIPLTEFKPRVAGGRGRSRNHPVSVEVLRGQRKVVQGAFLGVDRKPSKRISQPRVPTRTLYGPGVPMMFIREEVNRAMLTVTDRVLPRRIESEMVRQLRKIETGKLPPVR